MSVSRCGPHEVGDCGVVCLPSAQRYCSVASRAHFPLATYTTDCAARRRQRLVRRSPVSTGGSLPSYLCLCERDQQPKRVVYGRRIAEDGGDIRIEENNICALSITLVVLAPHGSAEVVFRDEVVVLRLASRTHTVFTVIRRRLVESPIVMERGSSSECCGSRIVPARGSPNTVDASSKDTPCLAKFRAAFAGSHSNCTTP